MHEFKKNNNSCFNIYFKFCQNSEKINTLSDIKVGFQCRNQYNAYNDSHRNPFLNPGFKIICSGSVFQRKFVLWFLELCTGTGSGADSTWPSPESLWQSANNL